MKTTVLNLRWVIVERVMEIEREREGYGEMDSIKSQTGIGLVRLSFARREKVMKPEEKKRDHRRLSRISEETRRISSDRPLDGISRDGIDREEKERERDLDSTKERFDILGLYSQRRIGLCGPDTTRYLERGATKR